MSQTGSPAVGIDLGTTYSCVGVVLNGKVEIIANEFGKRTTPSCVAFVDSEDVEVVGDAALNQAMRNPTRTVREVKRLIGRQFHDETVQQVAQNASFRIVNDAGLPRIAISHRGQDKTFTPQQISCMILEKLKSTAEDFLNRPVKDAVITHPAYFTDPQKRATKEAAEMAGLRVLRMIPEPSAAALAYGMDRLDLSSQRPRNVLIYDLGGGTFDVTVATVHGAHVEVRAVDGNSRLGGYDFDIRLLKYVAEQVKRDLNRDVLDQPARFLRLLALCDKAKRDLSALTKVQLDLEPVVGEEYSVPLSRAGFEELCRDLLAGTMDTVRAVLESARMAASQIQEVILVGGSTRIPCIHSMLKDLFPGKDICRTVNPDEAVAHGAALLAAKLSSEPDDHEALSSIMVQNVTPLSIGINVGGGEYYVMIPRNSKIPASKQTILVTSFHNQSNVAFSVYQGERSVAARNMFIGRYTLHELPAVSRAGLPCDASLSLDEDGILVVRAKAGTSTEWRGCTLEVRDCTATEVMTHGDDVARFKEDDDSEAERLRARFNLQVYLRNEASTATGFMEKQAFAETQSWFDSNQSASTENFKKHLKELKRKVEQSKRPSDYWNDKGLGKRRK